MKIDEIVRKNVAEQKAIDQLKTADDFVRSLANAATFGLADKLAAAGSALTGKADYNKEVQKQQELSKAAAARSPTATTAGEIAGTVGSLPFVGGAVLGAKALGKAAPKIAQRADRKSVGRERVLR
jgi:hypothetical protein